MSDSSLTIATILQAQRLIDGLAKPTHIGPDVAQWLKREHGATDESLHGMNVIVSDVVPPGKAYMIGPPEVYGPPRPPIQWIALKGIALRPMQVVCLNRT